MAFSHPLATTQASAAPAAENCTFILGFKAIHDLIPGEVGDCRTNEYHNGQNGDGLQETNGKDGKGGLLVWRKSDNWTAYTDGFWTWVNGPNGLQKRLNTERFPFENDGQTGRISQAQIFNGTYSFPSVKTGNVTWRFTNGKAEQPYNGVMHWMDEATIISDKIAYGDLNGDGVPEAVVPIMVYGGANWAQYWVIAVTSRNGQLQQLAFEGIGTEVRFNSLTVSSGKVTADYLIFDPALGSHAGGPNKPVVRQLSIPQQNVPIKGQP